MIRLNKKVRAFTLGELLVTLVIATLVIGLAMLVLSLINRQLGVMRKNNDRATEVRLLEKALWQDFNTHNLYFNEEQQDVQGISSIDTVTYQLNKNYVIRNRDTLQIAVLKVMSYLDGASVTNGTIDALKLQFSENPNQQNIFIYKTKDAVFYINEHGI